LGGRGPKNAALRAIDLEVFFGARKIMEVRLMNKPLLAERWKRLAAAIADFAFAIGAVFLMTLILPLFGISPDHEANVAAFGLLALMVVQLVLLGKKGQTLGKLVFRIKIVDRNTLQNPGFIQTGLVRGFLYAFSITLIVPLVDALWIFKKGNRCLHDLIAGTIVIQHQEA
jgi:uncharacterized RDD family membrane protein YckC